jgi:cholesterol transport system auxiliary component
MEKGRDVTAIVRKTAPIAAALLPALLLAGCISLTSKPPRQLISLTPDAVAPAGDLGAGSTAPPLVVLEPETERELDMLRVPVKIDPSGLAYLKGAIWVEKPSRQFRTLLAETIRAKDNRLVFEGIGAAEAGRPVLSGRLNAMGYDAASSSVIVRFDAQLLAPGTPLKVRRFESKVSGVAADAQPVAAAIDRAANDVAAQVADWVK